MIATALWLAVGAGAASFPLEEPPEPAPVSSSATIQALYGETPPLRIAAYLPEGRALSGEERAALFREVSLARDFYRNSGLLVREDMRQMDPTGDMLEIRRRVRAVKLAPGVSRERAEAEAFAQWCELRGARALYPKQFRRLMEQANRERKACFVPLHLEKIKGISG